MKIIYCDGSEKKDGTIVTSFVLATRDERYGRIRSVDYCHKHAHARTTVGGCAEILAGLDAWCMLPQFEIPKNEKIIIINDNISNVAILKNIKDGLRVHKKCLEPQVKAYLDILPTVPNLDFKQKPRQTMGLVLADYLNYETAKWVRGIDSYFIGLRMRQMINRPWDYLL